MRSHTLRLRQKPDAYFEEEGAGERLRITIPRGGYVPDFVDFQPITPPLEPDSPAGSDVPQEAETAAVSQLQRTQRRLVGISILLSFLCILLATLLIVRSPIPAAISSPEQSIRHELWKNLLSPTSTTILVAADSGLVMLHGATGQNSSLSEYLF